MTPYFITVVCGASWLVASATLGLWQILSAPDRPNYPTSGTIKRCLMFLACGFMGGRGIEVIDKGDGWVTASGELMAPVSATATQATLSILMAALFTTFLIDHCRNWLPKRTWDRIRQLLALARCKPSKGLIDARASAMANSTGGESISADIVIPSLVELHMQGVHVVGPNEGPSAIHGR